MEIRPDKKDDGRRKQRVIVYYNPLENFQRRERNREGKNNSGANSELLTERIECELFLHEKEWERGRR